MWITYFLFIFLYNVLQIAFLPFILSYLIYRKLRGKSVFGNAAHRLGFIPQAKTGQPVAWVHAVSVGETLSTEFLIRKLRSNGYAVYLTYGTAGAQRVAQHLEADYQAFLPFDFLLPMMLAFRRIRPKLLVIIEAERWPNLIFLAHVLRVRCIVLNARVAEKPISRHPLMQLFLRMQYQMVDHLYTQCAQDEQRFRECGIEATKISLLGNIKTANVLAKRPKELAVSPHHYFILMAGSIHPTEETVYLEAMTRIKKQDPFFKLLLLPRHFHWLAALETAVKIRGISYVFVREKKSAQEVLELFATYDVVITATMGMMFSLYEIASLFALGGTFVPVGGHNLLEPAVWGKASLVGPDVHSTRDVAEKLKEYGALVQVADAEHMAEEILALIDNPSLPEEMGKRAYRWLAAEAAAIDERVDMILKGDSALI